MLQHCSLEKNPSNMYNLLSVYFKYPVTFNFLITPKIVFPILFLKYKKIPVSKNSAIDFLFIFQKSTLALPCNCI